MRSRLAVALLCLAGALSGLGSAPAAQAHGGHGGAVRLGLAASSATIASGATVSITGTSRGRTTGVVKLLEASGRSWVRVARLRSNGRRYTFSLTPAVGSHVYRATQRNARGDLVSSPSVKVTVTTAVAVGPELAAARVRILADTNAYRSDAGLAPLRETAAADAVAQAWTERMAGTADFEHNPDYTAQMPPHWSRVGENIAYGYSPDSVGAGWFASPDHRANMLGDYTVIGIGYAEDADGRGYFTQDFGKY